MAGPPPGRGPRVHRLLHPLLALLAQPGQPVHRPLPRGPRGPRQRDHARTRGAAHRHAHPGLAARRSRLPLLLHREVAPLPLPHPRHGGLRLRRLGRQRPALHGLGGHRRPLRSASSPPTPPIGSPPNARPATPGDGLDGSRALVPDGGPGQPARRHVVPGRPARLPRRSPRRRRRHPAGARVRRVEGRRPPARLHRPLSRGGRHAAGQLRRRPAHQARGPPAVALGPAARPVGVHRSGRQGGLAAPSRLLRPPAPAGRPEPGHGPLGARGLGGLGRHGDHLHLRPRRHVRLARAPFQGSLRLRRDHAGALST